MFKKGDKIKYTEDRVYSFITLGNTYVVKKDQMTCGGDVRIDDDDGDESPYPANVFTLVAPALDLTKPLETMGGEPVTLLSTEARGNYPLIGYRGERTFTSEWTAGGVSAGSPALNLRNVAPKPVTVEFTGYVNVYKNADGTLRSGLLFEEKPFASEDAVGRVKVTFTAEEGKFEE